MPIAPVPLFGIVQKLSLGHAVSTILLAMVAMILTAFSYGRMAALYPSAGSAYTYVGRGLNAHLGFLAGWAMFLDYLLVPMICTIYGALTVKRLVPEIPFVVWAALFAGTMTVVNLRGIRTTAKTKSCALRLDVRGRSLVRRIGRPLSLRSPGLAWAFCGPTFLPSWHISALIHRHCHIRRCADAWRFRRGHHAGGRR
jgi:amino acid transporter